MKLKLKIKNLEKYLAVLGLLCIIGIIVGYNIFTVPYQNKTRTKNQASLHDLPPDDFDNVWKFALTDQFGNKFDSQNLKGKLTLVYFGFTFCPDICPNSLSKIVEIISACKKYAIDLTTIFITIDPTRDTSANLMSYLQFFDADIIGLTGSPDEIKTAASIFKVYYAKDKDADAKNYMLNHSSFIYLIDKNGKLAKLFSFEEKPQEIIEFIRVNFRK
jgi:protein SCO1/2